MYHTSSIQGIAFDFGRVLSDFNHLRAVGKLAEHAGCTLEETRDRIFKSGLSDAHESGKLTEHDFYTGVCSSLGITGMSEQTFRDIWQDIFLPNTGIQDLLRRLRPDLPKVVLSNTDPIHWEAIRKLPVMRGFFHDDTCLIRSYDVGARKPSAEMYEAMLARLELKPPSVLYIDDIFDYVHAFEAMGGVAEQYDCSKQSLRVLEEILARHNCLRY